MLNYHSGCEAVAFGAWEAGVSNLYSYPGSPVTEIVEVMATLPKVTTRWATNEKVALEMAAGSSHSGQRTLVVMKHVGLNVAADPLYNLAYTGVVGGLVLAIGDDPGARNSQNEQDTRQVCQAAGVVVLEPASVREAQSLTREAFALSEHYDLPVVVRLTSRLCYSKDKLQREERQQPNDIGDFATPLSKYLLLPAFVPQRHRVRNQQLANLALSAQAATLSQLFWPEQQQARYPLGIISSGFASGVVRELFRGEIPLLCLQLVYPLPADTVKQFAARCERVLVAEESSNFLDQQVRALGIRTLDKPAYDGVGEFCPQSLRLDSAPELWPLLPPEPIPELKLQWLDELPARPPGFCGGCPHTGIFRILSDRQLYVVGDIGCSTLGALEPFKALHSNLCMGASLGMLHGYLDGLGEAAASRCVAVLGDSTFFHSGMTGMMSLVQQQCRGTVIILDNSGSAMTGMQYTSLSLDAQGWRQLLSGLGVSRPTVLPSLENAPIERWLDQALSSAELSVLVLKGSCVQDLKISTPTPFRYTINEDACTNCGICVEQTNCRNFSVIPTGQDGMQITITDSCIGCGLCSQSCPEQAIIPLSVATLLPEQGRTGRWLRRQAGRLPWARLIRKLNQYPQLQPWLQRFERLIERRLTQRQTVAAEPWHKAR